MPLTEGPENRRQHLDRGVAFARDDGDEIAEASRACATGWRAREGSPAASPHVADRVEELGDRFRTC